MNQFTGKSLIAGRWLADETASVFSAFSPLENNALAINFTNATAEQTAEACLAADKAFEIYGNSSKQQRIDLLNTIADQILELGDELLEITEQETGLPQARLIGERGRTVNQLKAFANLLLNPIEPMLHDKAEPNREPLPKPDTFLDVLPLGPVAVFGASNFPYAFSTAGGDTASALAAGCPVVVKGHPAHPGTSELMAKAISKALDVCQLPQGVFNLLQSNQVDVAHQLVKSPFIKAVGFTGSYAVAMELQKSINQREELIPLYGELGSINPQVVLADKIESDGKALAETLTQSLLMGNGQFCTSPGVWLIPEQDHGFIEHLKAYVPQQVSAPLLTPGIYHGFNKAVDFITSEKNVTLVAQANAVKTNHAPANIYTTDFDTFINNKALQEEIFGPYALVVSYKNLDQLIAGIRALPGQLTASIHGTDKELQHSQRLITALSHKVGRLIFNQMPTGVEVCHSMNHGGPYPASTDVRSTSVGSNAIKRFQRPICYQNMPEYLIK